jgi:hypothetical protein
VSKRDETKEHMHWRMREVEREDLPADTVDVDGGGASLVS